MHRLIQPDDPKIGKRGCEQIIAQNMMSLTQHKLFNAQRRSPQERIFFTADIRVETRNQCIPGTHGTQLRFDILEQISEKIPNTPLVLHGASTVPQKFINGINRFGGNIQNAHGISPAQLRTAIKLHITKINIDSDSRLAFTYGVREKLVKTPGVFDPREYLKNGIEKMMQNCIDEIQNIMGSGYKI